MLQESTRNPLAIRTHNSTLSIIHSEFFWNSIRNLLEFYQNSFEILSEFFGNSLEILWEVFGNSLIILWEFIGKMMPSFWHLPITPILNIQKFPGTRSPRCVSVWRIISERILQGHVPRVAATRMLTRVRVLIGSTQASREACVVGTWFEIWFNEFFFFFGRFFCSFSFLFARCRLRSSFEY